MELEIQVVVLLFESVFAEVRGICIRMGHLTADSQLSYVLLQIVSSRVFDHKFAIHVNTNIQLMLHYLLVLTEWY